MNHHTFLRRYFPIPMRTFYWKSTDLHPPLSSSASITPLALSSPFHRVQNNLDPRTGQSSTNSAPALVNRSPFTRSNDKKSDPAKSSPTLDLYTDFSLIKEKSAYRQRDTSLSKERCTPLIYYVIPPHEKISRHRSKRIRRFFIQRTSRPNAGITFSLTFPQKASHHRSCCTIQRATVRAASISFLNSAFDSAFSSPISPFSMKSR